VHVIFCLSTSSWPGDALVLRTSVLAAVRGLPPGQRAVIALRYLADLTEAQTAAAMRCSTGTVKGLLRTRVGRVARRPGVRTIAARSLLVQELARRPHCQQSF